VGTERRILGISGKKEGRPREDTPRIPGEKVRGVIISKGARRKNKGFRSAEKKGKQPYGAKITRALRKQKTMIQPEEKGFGVGLLHRGKMDVSYQRVSASKKNLIRKNNSRNKERRKKNLTETRKNRYLANK